MAAHTTTTYSCDKCGAPLTEKPPTDIHVQASKNGEWSMEFKVDWRDLCAACRKDVIEFFAGRAE